MDPMNQPEVKRPTFYRFFFFVSLAFALGIGVGLIASTLQVSLIAFILLVIAILAALVAGQQLKRRALRLQKIRIRQ